MRGHFELHAVNNQMLDIINYRFLTTEYEFFMCLIVIIVVGMILEL